MLQRTIARWWWWWWWWRRRWRRWLTSACRNQSTAHQRLLTPHLPFWVVSVHFGVSCWSRWHSRTCELVVPSLYWTIADSHLSITGCVHNVFSMNIQFGLCCINTCYRSVGYWRPFCWLNIAGDVFSDVMQSTEAFSLPTIHSWGVRYSNK